MNRQRYDLVCAGCGARYADDGTRLQCEREHAPALLRTVYAQRTLAPTSAASAARYACWLPGEREIATAARTGVYRSRHLAAQLGLRNLWVAFSGWWPEREATLPTGTFKDLEAIGVLRRRAPAETRTLVISSAGNTALAFARACGENDVPVLIVVPLRGWREVEATAQPGPAVRIVAMADAGYEEAIGFARELCADGQFILEGGVRNVGRRDGMGTAMLAAVETIGQLPDVYVQAVGSAAGALAAHEAAQRLVIDGRYGTTLPRLLIAQNAPFAPIHDAWQAHSEQLLARDATEDERALANLGASVLSTKTPPYAFAGGIRAALMSSGGTTQAIDNTQLANAMSLFAELEGATIEPAAAVAVAALARAVRTGAVSSEACVLLHVTGGGRASLPKRRAEAIPALTLERDESRPSALDRARALVR